LAVIDILAYKLGTMYVYNDAEIPRLNQEDSVGESHDLPGAAIGLPPLGGKCCLVESYARVNKKNRVSESNRVNPMVHDGRRWRHEYSIYLMIHLLGDAILVIGS
jgi:hypothetical protein